MVTALAVYGWIVLDDIEAKKPNTLVVERDRPAVRLELRLPGASRSSPTELVLPKDRPVEFRIKTEGRAPRLLGAAVPAQVRRRAGPDHQDPRSPRRRIGEYDVVCAELCGIGHSTMRQTVRVVQPARLPAPGSTSAEQSAGDGGAAAAGGDTAAAGKQLFTDTGCDACHTLADAGLERHGRPEAGRAGRGRPPGAASPRASRPRSTCTRPSIEDPSAFVVQGFRQGHDAQDLRQRALAGGDRHAREVPSRRGRRR